MISAFLSPQNGIGAFLHVQIQSFTNLKGTYFRQTKIEKKLKLN